MTTTIERFHEPEADRYAFDFRLCHFKDGWAQCDTGQDAWYYGQWAHPWKLKIATYCEGDVTIETASSAEEFARLLRNHKAWNTDNGHRFAIDGMCQRDIIGRFSQLGLADLLH